MQVIADWYREMGRCLHDWKIFIWYRQKNTSPIPATTTMNKKELLPFLDSLHKRRFQPSTGRIIIITSYQTFYHQAIVCEDALVAFRKPLDNPLGEDVPPSTQPEGRVEISPRKRKYSPNTGGRVIKTLRTPKKTRPGRDSKTAEEAVEDKQ